MDEAITQGTILYPIKSKKYIGIRCYGIIISARCDIAQGKVDKVYLLTAINTKEWVLSDIGFRTVYKDKLNNIEKELKEKIIKHDLSYDVLKSLRIENVRIILDEKIGKNSKLPV